MAVVTTARIRSWFETFGIDTDAHAALNGDASAEALFARIAAEINSGQRTLDQFVGSLIRASGDGGVEGILNLLSKRGLTANDVILNSGISGLETATSDSLAEQLSSMILSGALSATDLQAALDATEPVGAITVDPGGGAEIPPAEPIEVEDEGPPPLSLEEQANLIFPYLPDELINIYVDAWAESGSQSVALATMRNSDVYDDFFAGNKREDGTVRLSEAAYISTLEGYSIELLSFGLNPTVFENQMISAIVNGVSVAELGQRLDLAFEGLLGTNLEEVKQFFALDQGIQLTDEAIFAAVIDPTVGESIIRQQISVAQVGAAALLQGFSFGEVETLAGELAGVGFGLNQALGFFGQAKDQTPVLTALAKRFSDLDSTFDLNEFAEASVFGDAFQRRRLQRLQARDQAQFRDTSRIATDEEGALTGLTVR